IEFTFLFTSPLLYFIHSVYTGLAGATLYVLDVRHGFSWGGSVIDYALNLGIAASGWLIIPVGLAFGVLYYFTFYTLIVKRNIRNVDREHNKEFSDAGEDTEKEREMRP